MRWPGKYRSYDFDSLHPLMDGRVKPGHDSGVCGDDVGNTQTDDNSAERALEVLRAHRLRPACDIVEALYQAVYAFTQSNALFDDVTSLVIKVGETGG